MTSSIEHLPDRRTLYPLIGSVILFLVACATPALLLHVGQQFGVAGFHWQNYQSISGGHLLVSGLAFGWLRMNFTAFANLPLWTSWILLPPRPLRVNQTMCVAGSVSGDVATDRATVPLGRRGDQTGLPCAPHIGFVCWIGSMLFMAVASHYLLSAQRQHISGSISV